MNDREIKIELGKTLKLSNVIGVMLDGNEVKRMNKSIEMLQHYIKAKKMKSVGPIIQCIGTKRQLNSRGDISVEILQQVLEEMDICEAPYFFKKELKVTNCIYGKYQGPKSTMQFVFDKVKLVAFEKYLDLEDKSYTVILNGEYENFIMDVFVQIKEDC